MTVTKRLVLLLCVITVASQFAFSETATEESRRADILKYGLESEIVDLVAQQRDDDDSLSGELSVLFEKTRSPAVRESILNLFARQENTTLTGYCLGVLEDPYDQKSSTVSAVFSYVERLKISEAAPHVRKLLENESGEWRSQSIRTLGKIGLEEDARFLVGYLDGEMSGDQKQRLIVRQEVMAALGELKALSVWDRIVEIASDGDENAVIRATAARTLGAMGKSEAIPILSVLFEDQDPFLRAAAVAGMANFSGSEAEALVLEGFRDTHYKVRLEALSACEKMKFSGASGHAIYRAKTDPVEAVRIRAFEVVANLSDGTGVDWLVGLVADDKTPDKIRVKAIQVLWENDFGRIEKDVERIALSALKDDKKTWIRYEVGKVLSDKKKKGISSVTLGYLQHKDPMTKAIGIEMYSVHRFSDAREIVETIAADGKMGGLQSRAKRVLEK